MKYSNNNSETADKTKGAAIGNILAIVNCIGLLGQVNDFSDWVSKVHHLELNKELFEGYKFTFDVLFGRLFDEIGRNSSLDLKEDMWLSRALFAGIPISKVPNTSEKAVLLRNIHYLANKLNFNLSNSLVMRREELLQSGMIGHLTTNNGAKTACIHRAEPVLLQCAMKL